LDLNKRPAFAEFVRSNTLLYHLCNDFNSVKEKLITPEALREMLRDQLIQELGHRSYERQLPGIELSKLIEAFLEMTCTVYHTPLYCSTCQSIKVSADRNNHIIHSINDRNNIQQEWEPIQTIIDIA
jgi:hypothetical protein